MLGFLFPKNRICYVLNYSYLGDKIQSKGVNSVSAKTIKIIITVFIIVLLVVLTIWLIWANKALELTSYTISSNKLPASFDGYRIAHISDLHNTQMGKDNEKLIAMLQDSEPDIIAITGDLIDSRNTDIEIALQFAEKAVKIAPCYYVTGNHESRVSEYDDLKKGLTESGVIVLENDLAELEKSGETITLMGVDDPSFQTDYIFGDSETVMKSKLQELTNEESAYTVLLSHRPELFDTYVESGIDLVLSGHAHGGQIRLPFVGGLVAPNQGLFPEYDAGIYTNESTNMIVSRGIGNSIIPLRINNRPEVIIIELEHKK